MPDSNITKNALANELKKLMNKKPFAKISVGDICEACGMNRKSFYYHFRDKYDLVNWIFDTEFIEAASSNDYETWWQFLESIFLYFYKEQDFYRHALQITGQNSFQDYFKQKVQPVLAVFAKGYLDENEKSQIFISFFTDAFIAFIIGWLVDGTKQFPPDEFLKQLKEMLIYFSKHILQDFENADK